MPTPTTFETTGLPPETKRRWDNLARGVKSERPLATLPDPREKAYEEQDRVRRELALKQAMGKGYETPKDIPVYEDPLKKGMAVAANTAISVAALPYSVAAGIKDYVDTGLKYGVNSPEMVAKDGEWGSVGAQLATGATSIRGMTGKLHVDPTVHSANGGKPPLTPQEFQAIEKSLSDRINEIDKKISGRSVENGGLSKEEIRNLNAEKRELGLQLIETVKARNTTAGLRGKKTLLNDEGIPKVDKIDGPTIGEMDRKYFSQYIKDPQIRKEFEQFLTDEDINFIRRDVETAEDWDLTKDNPIQAVIDKTRQDWKTTQELMFPMDPETRNYFLTKIKTLEEVRDNWWQQTSKKKVIYSDEGIPPTDKINGPKVEMFDKNMPMDRVQAEIKKIQQVMRDMGEGQPTTKDIALHVYGSDEEWATRRIRDAMKKLPDTIGVDKPPIDNMNNPLSQVDESIIPFSKKSAPWNDNTPPLPDLGLTESGVRKVPLSEHDMQFEQAWQDMINDTNNKINILQRKIDDATKTDTPDLTKLRKHKEDIAKLQEYRQTYVDAIDTLHMNNDPQLQQFIKDQTLEAANLESKPLVDNYLDTLYGKDKFFRNRIDKADIEPSEYMTFIDLVEQGDANGLKYMVRMYEKSTTDRGKILHRFATDLLKMLENQ